VRNGGEVYIIYSSAAP